MILDWDFFFSSSSYQATKSLIYSNFTFLPLCDNRNALCFLIFGLYFYLCFGMPLLTPLGNFTSLILLSLLCTANVSVSFQVAFQHMQVSPFKTKHMSFKLLLYFFLYFNANLFKKLSVLTITQLMLYPFHSAFLPSYFHQNSFIPQFIFMWLNSKDIFKSLPNLCSH